MHGILIVDKPENYTSRDVVNIVSRVLHTKKVGHTGTLDPMATGLLVLCVGDYTKFVSRITSHDKVYLVTLQFGMETDTLDITGSVLRTSKTIPTIEQIQEILPKFLGSQKQEVPLYSAKKVNGKKLYEYARNHEAVSLPVQDIEIYALEFISYQSGKLTLRCHVSKGTYIRSLVRDISYALQTLGVMMSLRREKLGNFDLNDAISLDSISNEPFSLLDFHSFLNYQTYEAKDKDMYVIYHRNELYLPFEEEYVLVQRNEVDIALYVRCKNRYKPLLLFDKDYPFL